MKSRSVASCAQFLAYIYICRAIFHDGIFQGTRMPFFNNLIWNVER
jgi:hypothetical protein